MDFWWETEVRTRHADLLASAGGARVGAMRSRVRRSLRHLCADIFDGASIALGALARAVRGTQHA